MTASPAGQTTAERLAAAWNDSEWVVIGSGESRRIVMAEDHERWEHLAPLVEQIAAERAAAELEAARARLASKPSPVAWLRSLDDQIAALRAAHQPNGGQPAPATDGTTA